MPSATTEARNTAVRLRGTTQRSIKTPRPSTATGPPRCSRSAQPQHAGLSRDGDGFRDVRCRPRRPSFHTDQNTITLTFSVAPALGFRIASRSSVERV